MSVDAKRRVVIAADVDYREAPLYGRWLVDWARAFAALGARVEVISRFDRPDEFTDALTAVGVSVLFPVRADHVVDDGVHRHTDRVRFVREVAADLDRHCVLFVQGEQLCQSLAGTGELNRCLWAMPLDDPFARPALGEAFAKTLPVLSQGAKQVLVTDAVAAAWVEGMDDGLTSRVRRWPLWANGEADADGVAATFVIHPAFARGAHASQIERWAEGPKGSAEASTTLLGSEEDLTRFRAGAGRELGWSLPGLHSAEAVTGPAWGLVTGSLAEPLLDTSMEAATWFEAHGISPLVFKGSQADREGPQRWTRVDGRFPTDPGVPTSPEAARGFDDLVADLAALYTPSPARALTTGRKRRVLLSGRNFKFAGELLAFLDGADDIELRVHVDNATTAEERDALAAWADIIICEFAWAQAVWHSWHVRPDQKLIVRLHGSELFTGAVDRLEVERCSAIVFVSDHHRDTAIRERGWPAERCVVIPNCVDLVDLDRPKLPGTRFNLGLVGIVPILKRPDRALDLLMNLRQVDSRYRLFVRGHHPWHYPLEWSLPLHREAYLDFYRRIAEDERLADAVTFEPFGPSIANWYRKIGWMLSPSSRESFHLAPAEGMVSGAVPVVWERDGARDIFTDRWTHADTDEATAFVLGHNRDDAAYAEESEAARRFIGRYSARDCNRAWMELLDSVAPVGREPWTTRGIGVTNTPFAFAGDALRAMWDGGAHADARAALEGLKEFTTQAKGSTSTGAEGILKAQSLINGWGALGRKFPRLVQAGMLSPEPTDPLLVVHGPGREGRDPWLGSSPDLHQLSVDTPWCIGEPAAADVTDPGGDLDAYVERIADRIVVEAHANGTRLLVADGPTWLAAAVAVAAARLGASFWWDLRSEPGMRAEIAAGVLYSTADASPMYETAFRVALKAEALIIDRAQPELVDQPSIAPRLRHVGGGEHPDERSLWRAHRAGQLRTPEDRGVGLWTSTMSVVAGEPRIAVVGEQPAGVEHIVAVDRDPAEVDPELHDALLVDGSTPEAWAATLPVLRAARRFEVPTIVWGLPATGRAFADVLAVPGEVPPEAAHQARPILATVQVGQDGEAAIRLALRASGLSVAPSPIEAPERTSQRVAGDLKPARPEILVRVNGRDGLEDTLADLAGQRLHASLFEVALDDAQADLAARHPRLRIARDADSQARWELNLEAGDRVGRDALLAAWSDGADVMLLPGTPVPEPLAGGAVVPLTQVPSLLLGDGVLIPRGGAGDRDARMAELIAETGPVARRIQWGPDASLGLRPRRVSIEKSLRRLDAWARVRERNAAAAPHIDLLAQAECDLHLRRGLVEDPDTAVALRETIGERPASLFPAVNQLLA